MTKTMLRPCTLLQDIEGSIASAIMHHPTMTTIPVLCTQPQQSVMTKTMTKTKTVGTNSCQRVRKGQWLKQWQLEQWLTKTPTEPTTKPTTTDFDLSRTHGDNIPVVNIIEEDVQGTNLAAELLQIHHQMGHAPFTKLQELAKPFWQDSKVSNPNVYSMCIQKGQQKRMESKDTEKQPDSPATR
jgi:hypothetical protein